MILGRLLLRMQVTHLNVRTLLTVHLNRKGPVGLASRPTYAVLTLRPNTSVSKGYGDATYSQSEGRTNGSMI